MTYHRKRVNKVAVDRVQRPRVVIRRRTDRRQIYRLKIIQEIHLYLQNATALRSTSKRKCEKIKERKKWWKIPDLPS